MSSDSIKVEITDSEKTSKATIEPANEQFDLENQKSEPFKASTEETPTTKIIYKKTKLPPSKKSLFLSRIHCVWIKYKYLKSF